MPIRIVCSLWFILPLLGGCAGVPKRIESRLPPERASSTVFVANGAGGRQDAARAIIASSENAGLKVHVKSFDWTHGRGRGLVDLADSAHIRKQGMRLACEVKACQANQPGQPIALVGYSAGCAVILAAASCLPANSIDRIVLLAPAVSAKYDIRKALGSASRGVDAFTSERDWFWLGMGTSIVGTPDGGGRGQAAGKVGFAPPNLFPGEEALAARLRQHPWDKCVEWTGNKGGHAGALEPAYLRLYVLPLLAPDRCTRGVLPSPNLAR